MGVSNPCMSRGWPVSQRVTVSRENAKQALVEAPFMPFRLLSPKYKYWEGKNRFYMYIGGYFNSFRCANICVQPTRGPKGSEAPMSLSYFHFWPWARSRWSRAPGTFCPIALHWVHLEPYKRHLREAKMILYVYILVWCDLYTLV